MKTKLIWIAIGIVALLAVVSQQYNLLIAAVGVGVIFGFYFLIFRLLWHAGSKFKSTH